MVTYQRLSPVAPMGRPVRVDRSDGWAVVRQYEDEGNGPYLIDLSHRPKWDIQDSRLSGIQPLGVTIPEIPGRCLITKGLLVSRMNRTQATLWQLLGPTAGIPGERPYTDITDAVALLALVGKDVSAIMEKITPLDLAAPERTAPCYFQGPVLHVPCQIVLLQKNAESQVILLGCSRGYGQAMAEALLDAGSQWGLRPGGEDVFINCLAP